MKQSDPAWEGLVRTVIFVLVIALLNAAIGCAKVEPRRTTVERLGPTGTPAKKQVK